MRSRGRGSRSPRHRDRVDGPGARRLTRSVGLDPQDAEPRGSPRGARRAAHGSRGVDAAELDHPTEALLHRGAARGRDAWCGVAGAPGAGGFKNRHAGARRLRVRSPLAAASLDRHRRRLRPGARRRLRARTSRGPPTPKAAGVGRGARKRGSGGPGTRRFTRRAGRARPHPELDGRAACGQALRTSSRA